MRVYRVEHREKVNDVDGLAPHPVGPFRTLIDGTCGAQLYLDACNASWFHFNRFPTPSAEGLPFLPHMICGCESLTALRAWFWEPGGLQAMHEAGYVVRAYDVPDIAVNTSPHQCTFPHDAAQRVEELPVMALAA